MVVSMVMTAEEIHQLPQDTAKCGRLSLMVISGLAYKCSQKEGTTLSDPTCPGALKYNSRRPSSCVHMPFAPLVLAVASARAHIPGDIKMPGEAARVKAETIWNELWKIV